MIESATSNLFILTGLWVLFTTVAAIMLSATRHASIALHLLVAVLLFLGVGNALIHTTKLFNLMAQHQRLPDTFPKELSPMLGDDSLLVLGFFLTIMYLLYLHRYTVFKHHEAPAVSSPESSPTPEQPPATENESVQLKILDLLNEKIDRLYMLDLPSDAFLRSIFEHLEAQKDIAAIWVGLKNSQGEVIPFFISDHTAPPLLDSTYTVSHIVSSAEASNPSEYAFANEAAHLFSRALEAPMDSMFYKRLKFSAIASVLSAPLHYPNSSSADGVISIYTDRPYTDTAVNLADFSDMLNRVMWHAMRLQEHHELQTKLGMLEAQASFYDNMIQTLPVRIYWKNRKLVYEGCNKLFCNDADENQPENIIGKTDHNLVWSDFAESFESNDLKVMNNGQEQVNQLEKQHNLWRLSNRSPLRDEHGNITGILGSYIDFTLQQRAFDYHEEKGHHFRALLNQMPTVAVQGFDAKRKINYWNRQSEILYGYSASEALGKAIDELLLPPEKRKTFNAKLSNWLYHDEKILPAIRQHLHRNGHLLTVKTSSILLDRTGQSPQFYTIDIDMTRQKEAEKKLKKLADYDALTHLPNRHYLNRHLAELLRKAERNPKEFAIFFIDLDNFKVINDTYGHHYGDELLIEASSRLKSVLRDYDFIARFGGDEFIVTLEYGDDEYATTHIASKMISVLRRPFEINNKDLFVSASIGISLFPKNSQSIDALLKHADTAMYKAKQAGKNCYAYFSESLMQEMSEKLYMETMLRKSFFSDDIHFMYQPQLDASTQKIVSCEALARWKNSDTMQYVKTATFLAAVERINMMSELTRKAIDSAIELLKTWRSKNIPLIRIDINVTSSILKDESIIEYMKKVLETHQISPRYLGIEITESQMIELGDPDSGKHLKALDDYGIHISIDDFGTGYSSLSYLSRLTIDTVKIDKSFIENEDDERNQAIIRSIIAMSHELGYDVIAEGVETEAQFTLLNRLNCDKIQGNLFYKPLLTDNLTDHLLQFDEITIV